MRPTDDLGNFSVATDVREGKTTVIITALDEHDQFLNDLSISGTVVGPDMASVPLRIEQTAPGRYVGEFESDVAGSYMIVANTGAGRAPIRSGVNVGYSAEYRVNETNMALLRSLSELKAKGGPAGDLYVVIHVAAHDLFERRGDDLFCEVPVPFETAALGGEIEVPTIDGFAKLKLSHGTQTGKVFRLRGKGLENVEGYGRGDLHIRIAAEVPVKLSSKQKKVLREYGEMHKDSNCPGIVALRARAEAFYERKKAIKES